MDSEVLLTLAGLVLYFLFQVLGARKRSRQNQPAPEAPPPDAEPASLPDLTLEDALREIREALGTAMDPEARRPEPEPSVEEPVPIPTAPDWSLRTEPARPAPSVESPRRPEMTPGPEFVPVASDHREAHFLDELEPTPSYDPTSTVLGGADDLNRTSTSGRRADLLRRLRRPDTIRDAVLLSEVIQPPRALRAQRRR